MTTQEVFQILKRDSISIFSEEGLKEKLESGKRLKIKLGADPSRPDLHLGHSVVLRKLKMLQDLGHEIIFVIGDFTGMIGDPSGKSKTRKPLTFEETRRNGKTYMDQVAKILDPEKTTIVYNSDWLGKMTFADVLQLAGKYTVARIMERDDFAKRFAENQAIGVHEMLYPLMQGYDSVALHADIEVGGSDQTFNLLVGRELQRDYGQAPQEVITFPLLPGLDGVEKMSKSLDNYIGVDEEPGLMFEKAMKVPDTLIEDYFRLTTDMAESEYKSLMAEDIRKAHFAYAREIVRMYHGEQAADEAEKRYNEVAKGGIPQNIATVTLPKEPIGIIALVAAAGLAPSNSEARRLIQGGGIKLDNKQVTDTKLTIEGVDEIVVSKGKNKFVKVIFA
ncbi:MAG: tyrosine--tRNA ligase [Ruminococcaceae bacterium]|nr:tyrosine--tRNA ligase [Oscillospiraceae bacterium]